MEQPRMQSVLYVHSFADSIVDDLNLLCHSFRGRFPFTLPSKCINNMLSTVLCQVEEFNWKRRRRGGVWSTWSGVCDKDMNNWMPVPIPANARCPIWKPRQGNGGDDRGGSNCCRWCHSVTVLYANSISCVLRYPLTKQWELFMGF